MTHQTLKHAVQHLIETQVISSDRFNAVYQWTYKRLAKKGINTVTYELSDTQKIIVTRDTSTYHYSVELITLKPHPVVIQPTEIEPTSVNAVPVQLSLFDKLVVDNKKAVEYFRTHKKARRPKLVIDNASSPQLSINFDVPRNLATNVINLCEIRQKQQLAVQPSDWGLLYMIDCK